LSRFPLVALLSPSIPALYAMTASRRGEVGGGRGAVGYQGALGGGGLAVYRRRELAVYWPRELAVYWRRELAVYWRRELTVYWRRELAVYWPTRAGCVLAARAGCVLATRAGCVLAGWLCTGELAVYWR
jgi:hypothetical protein